MLRLVPFCDEQSSRPQFEMRLENNLLEFGPIHRLNLMRRTSVNNLHEIIPHSYAKLSEAFPVVDSDTDALKNFSKLGVSSDENAEKLTNLYLPGLSISVIVNYYYFF
jgi:hypothetical protein